VDSLYASRIVLESFGQALTNPRQTRAEVAKIHQTLKHMNAHDWIGDRAAWEVHHNAFHGLLVMHVGTVLGPMMAETIANFQLRAERYRRLYVSTDPNASAIAAADHARIVDAVARRETDVAVAALADHLSRTALRLLARKAENFEPKAVENALTLVTSSSGRDVERMSLIAHADQLTAVERAGSLPLKP
jgi:DNA-binding GntR family transcriptional regulator